MNETPKSKTKIYLFLFLIFLILIAGLFGYLKYRQFAELQETSKVAIAENVSLRNQVDEYTDLKNSIEQEKNRCEQLLLKEEGNFSDFTYCQTFIEFYDNNVK